MLQIQLTGVCFPAGCNAREQRIECPAYLRPDAVALLDASRPTGQQLTSALGRKHGDAHRALLAAA